MKGRNLLFSALAVLAVAVLMIISFRSITTTGIVIVGGVLFLLAGVVNLAVTERSVARRNRGAVSATFSRLSSVAAVILGACMLFFRTTFAELVNFMFGLLVLFGACYQFYILARASRPVRMPAWLYVAPALMTGVSVYLFVIDSTADSDSRIMLATGIGLAVLGVAGVIESAILVNGRRKLAAEEQLNLLEVEAETPAEPRPLDELPHD